MANNRFVYQQQTNVSIPRNDIVRLASNQGLKKNDYKVLLCLFSSLNGWNDGDGGYRRRTRPHDPENFKSINLTRIADTVNLSKKEVKESIKKLEDFDIIEEGSNDSVKKGYRFTF